MFTMNRRTKTKKKRQFIVGARYLKERDLLHFSSPAYHDQKLEWL